MAKWQEISVLVFNDLAGHAALTALLSNGADSIYPLIADAEEGDTFILYVTEYTGKASKDGSYNFTITIMSYAPSYNASLTVADAVTAAITASTNAYGIETGRPVFIAENEFYIEQIFNLKK